MGADTADDAAVYKLSPDLALISTLDFFTPMLDDPYAFGQVAAANALSDIYAMGGEPLLALNIVAFPVACPGGAGDHSPGRRRQSQEAGARLAGGHSIADDTPMYGLAVNGLVHPGAIWTNAGARAGDALVLTKPLGSGIVCTAIKAGLASPGEVAAITEIMTTLNARAARAARELEVHACTDITGFGLLGHLGEMMTASDTRAEIIWENVPLAPGARDHAEMGLVPGGAKRNLQYNKGMVEFVRELSGAEVDLLLDPQTSGGLLFSLPPKDADALVTAGLGWPIGRVLPPGGDKRLAVV